MSNEPLLSISEASQLLSVSEGALRQWTDEGKIKAFITPGGHRRYSKTELKKCIKTNTKVFGMKDLAAELEDAVQPLREIARTLLPSKSWYAKLDADSQQLLASLGRNMLQVIIKYITEPSRREETMKMARDVGRGFGQMLAKLGLSLTDSVEAFILHRDPIMNAATHLLKRREAFTGRVAEAIPLVAHIMDEALVSLVATYQQYRNGTLGDPEMEMPR